MPEFRTPLRVTWDLPADPATAAAHWSALVAARVLFVELALRPESLSGLEGMAAEVAVPGVPRLSLAAGAPEAGAALGILNPSLAAGVDLLLLPPHDGDLPGTVFSGFRAVTWAVWSTDAGLVGFPDALAAARAAGGGTVAVLNPPAPAAPLSPEALLKAVGTWEQHGTPEIQLRVHDLFLARDLGLEPFREYAGCQAGDALAHLGADGTVTACRTLPVVLGNLTTEGLGEIWAGEPRRELLRHLATAPASCAGCAVAERCRGGCRGLVPEGLGDAKLDARDPSCPGPLTAGEGALP